MNRASTLLFTLANLVAIVGAGCAVSKVSHGIPNLTAVSPGIYRGGQPDESGFAYLQSIGVSNVIKLNQESEGSDYAATELGMTVTELSMDSFTQLIGPVNPVIIRDAVAGMKPGTLVHCTHGQDRTGLVVACYRVWNQNWSKEKARQEMLALGFHPLLKGLDNFWEEKVKP